MLCLYDISNQDTDTEPVRLCDVKIALHASRECRECLLTLSRTLNPDQLEEYCSVAEL